MTNFITDTGVLVPAVDAQQMREVDRIAIEETGPNLFQMMENAGRNLALAVIETLGEGWRDARIVVLAGTGGNGGGGICAARHLANRDADVWLCLTRPWGLDEVPAFQHRVYAGTAGRELPLSALVDSPADLIVDAVIGYSLSGAPRGPAAELIGWANDTDAPIVSLDVPSELDASTGEASGSVLPVEYLRATRTMTLALPKKGLLPMRTGHLEVADIGIPEEVYRRLGIEYQSPFDGRYRVPLIPAS